MTQLNVASREAMKSAQVIECISLSTLDAALNDVRGEAVVLIVASITEFIISNGFSGTVQSSIEPVLGSYVTKICSFCAFRPQLQVRCLDRSTELFVDRYVNLATEVSSERLRFIIMLLGA